MTLYQQVGDRVGQTNINWALGTWLAQQGAFAEALPLLEQAVAFVREIRHPLAEPWGEVLVQVRARLAEETSA